MVVFFQYVFNGKRFSFGAAFNQSQRQIKSTGSLLIGGNFYYSKISNQPQILNEYQDYSKQNFIIGPNLGYAYTWVISANFYVSGTFTTGINGVFDKNLDTDEHRFLVAPQLQGRFSIGYNTSDWSANFSAIFNKTYINYESNYQSSLNSGQLQVTLIKRFNLKKDIPLFQKDLFSFPKSTTTTN